MEISEIKKVLKSKKITYDQLSIMSGVPKQTIQKIFAGYTKHPRIDTLSAIEQALGIAEDKNTLTNSVILREDELRLIAAYNSLVPAMQDYVLEIVERLVKTNASEKRA